MNVRENKQIAADRAQQPQYFIHFGDFLELSWSIIAADFTHGHSGMEKFNKALGMQLQVAEHRLHT